MKPELVKLLKKMDVPGHRVDRTTAENLRWLYQNLGKRNQNHPNYQQAMTLLTDEMKHHNVRPK
jgi:hypothetical protein